MALWRVLDYTSATLRVAVKHPPNKLTKRGMYETRRKGYYQGGGLPYGYKIDGRKIVIDDDAAEVVRYMYDQYAKGAFVKDIIIEACYTEANLSQRIPFTEY